jgi:hypothetical protein
VGPPDGSSLINAPVQPKAAGREDRKTKRKHMLFEYTRRRGVRSPVTDAATFKVTRLKQASAQADKPVDLSHLIDRSYNYHSPRELRWHIAERFGLPPATVALQEAH